MNRSEEAIHQLLDHLISGWRSEQPGSVKEFLQIWKERLNVVVQIKDIGKNQVQFTSEWSDIRLRGLSHVPCLLTTCKDPSVIREFWRQHAGLGKIPFVLAISEDAQRHAAAVITDSRGLLLSGPETIQLLTDSNPRENLIRHIRRQIPRQRLNPFDFLKPAEGCMFFGRRNELNRLRYEDSTSFAIVGPGKAGKSSLMKYYQQQMLRLKDPRSSYRHYIDFYDCPDLTPDGVARFLAMKIDSSRQSNRVQAKGLVDFLKYQAYRNDVALDLLLDEVDEVCSGSAFKLLGEAAKLGYCRLVLCGKASLLNLMLDEQSPLRGRVELLKLEPLEPADARLLLLEPFKDLGYEIEDPEMLVDRVFRYTGRFPHLLQLFGKRLAALMSEQGANLITVKDIETLKWDFTIAHIFTEPLRNLSNPEAIKLGLILLQDGRQEFSIGMIQEITRTEFVDFGHRELTKLCNELVINNVIAWNGWKYRIANEALYDYVKNLGLLEQLCKEESHVQL